MINPGGSYLTRQQARGNHITQKCVIEVGNYALASQGAAASASSTFSADWPAAAVVNGKVTHINAGAAGVADDGVGGGVYQGNVLADGSGNLATPEVLTIDLGQFRKVNRVKLIFWPDSTKNGNLGSIGPADFLIETHQISDPGSEGYGEGGYGEGTYDWGAGFYAWTGLADKCAEIGKSATTISGGQVTGNVNDMVVFEDLTPQNIDQLRITISKLQSGTIRTRIVAVEVTWAVDVSAYVKSAKRVRQKDYHLQRRTAAELDLTLINYDKRFNDRHTPTTAEIANGYFSNKIRPHLPIRYFAGFSGINVQMFSGNVETWNPDSKLRTVDTVSLDFLKSLVKPMITARGLKTGWLIEALVEYVANLQNFPSNMIRLDSSSITVGYFMPSGENIQTILNGLQDATGDAEIYVDEYGRLNYRNYLASVDHQFLFSTKNSWETGTLNSIDSTSQPASILGPFKLFDNFSDGKYASRTAPGAPEWTVLNAYHNYVLDASTGALEISVGGGTYLSYLCAGAPLMELPASANCFYRFKADMFDPGGGNYQAIAIMFFKAGAQTDGKGTGYGILFENSNGATGVYLVRYDNANAFSYTTLAYLGSFTNDGAHVWEIIRTASTGKMDVYKDGAFAGTGTDTTYSTADSFGFIASSTHYSMGMLLDDIYFSPNLPSGGIVFGEWDAPVLDFTAAVNALGLLTSVYTTATGASLIFQTRSGPTSSPDGSWSAWLTVTPGDPFGSPFNQYGQVQILFSGSISLTPIALGTVGQLAVNYTATAGSDRYGPTPDWVAADYGLLLGNNRVISSIVGGSNYVFTQAIVKAKPQALDAAASLAWQGTNNNEAISAGNPLAIPLGDTVIIVDFGQTKFNVPQTVNLTLGTATATAALSSHPSTPTLTITATVAGTIIGLTITGTAFLNNTTIQATAYAPQSVQDNYDENVDELDSNYIDNPILAQSVADKRISRFGQGALDWIKEGIIRFFPGAQINDRVTVTDSHAEIDDDYYLLSATDELQSNSGKQFNAKTTVELIKI